MNNLLANAQFVLDKSRSNVAGSINTGVLQTTRSFCRQLPAVRRRFLGALDLVVDTLDYIGRHGPLPPALPEIFQARIINRPKRKFRKQAPPVQQQNPPCVVGEIRRIKMLKQRVDPRNNLIRPGAQDEVFQVPPHVSQTIFRGLRLPFQLPGPSNQR